MGVLLAVKGVPMALSNTPPLVGCRGGTAIGFHSSIRNLCQDYGIASGILL